MSIEKRPLESKKFVAYLTASLSMKAVMLYSVHSDAGDTILLTEIVCSTFLDIGYIIGQAGLDLFVRGFGQAADAAKAIWGKMTGAPPEE